MAQDEGHGLRTKRNADFPFYIRSVRSCERARPG